MTQGLDSMDGITFHDLYQVYPEMNIDRQYEQTLVDTHDIIIFHYPFFWYSTPSLLKEWQDLVLVHGWAYGSKGNALKDKLFFNVISTGGTREFYCNTGRFNRYTIRQLLAPIEQTVNMCKMTCLPPFVVHGTHTITRDEVLCYKENYHRYLTLLKQGKIDISKLQELEYFNDYDITDQSVPVT